MIILLKFSEKLDLQIDFLRFLYNKIKDFKTFIFYLTK